MIINHLGVLHINKGIYFSSFIENELNHFSCLNGGSSLDNQVGLIKKSSNDIENKSCSRHACLNVKFCKLNFKFRFKILDSRRKHYQCFKNGATDQGIYYI